MERYLNLGRDSGVALYEFGATSITVQFNDGASYLYTNESAGIEMIAEMKKLAIAGRGLNSFINKNVSKKYARRFR